MFILIKQFEVKKKYTRKERNNFIFHRCWKAEWLLGWVERGHKLYSPGAQEKEWYLWILYGVRLWWVTIYVLYSLHFRSFIFTTGPSSLSSSSLSSSFYSCCWVDVVCCRWCHYFHCRTSQRVLVLSFPLSTKLCSCKTIIVLLLHLQ